MVPCYDLTKRCFAALLVALMGVSLHAQAKPDFSGTWIQVTSDLTGAESNLERQRVLFERGLTNLAQLQAAQAVVRRYRNAAPTLVVTQTGATITARQGSSEGGPVATYNLDGSETRSSAGAGVGVTIAKATWEGERLVIAETTRQSEGKTVQTKRVWSLDQAGQLVVETGDDASKQVVVYRKQPPLGAASPLFEWQ